MKASEKYRFDRMEFAGSLGDLGTLLPLAMGMILVNRLDPLGVFFSIGLYYVFSGVYAGVTVPVQPMKVIGAYAVATGISASAIAASAALMAGVLFVLGVTGAVTLVGKHVPKAVVRGVQLSTGVLLVTQGVRFVAGTSSFQQMAGAAEPYLSVQAVGPVPLGLAIGVLAGAATLLLLNNRRLPAGLAVILGGAALGAALGAWPGGGALVPGLHLPTLLPFGLPGGADATFALFALVLPQTPMTLGNAVIAYADLSQDYFGRRSARVTYRFACISMALANGVSFLLGGIPLCHGAGGLAAHFRFGARTAGSNLMIGGLFAALAILWGDQALALLRFLPMAVLGVLLIYAGSQLALTLLDVKERKDLFVAVLILGITLASSLAWGFVIGIAAAWALKSRRLSV
ncbi:MAG: putative sulfate/molybdate transporter [Deltaproteobacteria bacterium]|nr:putative sulfate/molybdate transporter [Deltaproteobacteria bacterium]